jgi:hypothetical protein
MPAHTARTGPEVRVGVLALDPGATRARVREEERDALGGCVLEEAALLRAGLDGLDPFGGS